MKRSLKSICLSSLLMALLLLSLPGCSSDEDDSGTNSTDTRADWTILSYGAGNLPADTSLTGDSYVIDHVQAMQQVDSSSAVNIVALVTSMKTQANTRYYEVGYHPGETGNTISSEVISDLGSKSTASPQTLQDFLMWGVTNYPAKHYLVIIDGTGDGWTGVCQDVLNGSGDYMSMPDLAEVLSSVGTSKGIGQFDVVAFTAPLMGMVEVAYELRESAKYMVASEVKLSLEGHFGYEQWLGNLVTTPSSTAATVAESIVDAIYSAAQSGGAEIHVAATDLSKVADLGSKLGTLADALVTNAGDQWEAVSDARESIHITTIYDSNYVDIENFTDKIKRQSGLSSIPDVVQAADSVLAAVGDAITSSRATVGGGPGGLTIHAPVTFSDYDSTNYATLDFQATGWTEFISAWLGNDSVTISGTISWPGQTLSHPVLVMLNESLNEIVGAYAMQGGAESISFTVRFPVSDIAASHLHATDDLNNNLSLFEEGEPFNCYDSDDADINCDYITYQPGMVMENVEFVLVVPVGAPTMQPVSIPVDMIKAIR